MKKSLLLLIINFSLFVAYDSYAQKSATMLIYKDGQIIKTIPLNNVDSITFTTCQNNCGKVKDFDGNAYNTIIIGTQCWMQSNLNTTHYSNGVPIPNVKDSTNWYNLSTGAYCNYDNDSINAFTYGRMYNWYAVANSNNLCPAGWHVPSNSDWTKLIVYLGDTNVAGSKMMESGTSHWQSPNIATNSSGFTALPGGYRDEAFFDFEDFQITCGLWSSTEQDTTNAWGISMIRGDASTSLGWPYKETGLSIRCLKGN